MDFSLSPAQEAFLDRVRAFARDEVAPRAAEIDATARYPRELVARAAEVGLLAMTLPPPAGGGQACLTSALAIELVAGASATVAVILTVTNALVVEPIAVAGTAAQRDAWLHRLASGAALGAFALSEADAGSDSANQQARATPVPEGYVLSGTKVWVANAEQADVAIVFAATAGDGPRRQISAFLVPLDAPGVSRRPCDSLGVRGLGCVDLIFDRVSLPSDARLGPEGGGFAIAMRALQGGRIAIAAQALGVGQSALDEALEYARTRHAFGQPIGQFQAIQFQLADLATELEAARLLTWRAADLYDRSPSVVKEAAMAKLQASEAAHAAADRAMQILASSGYRRGSRLERLFRDARATEIYQGTSEVQRLLIAKALLGGPAH
ncbi:MAG: acyl-CoA dehydrogenase family protein [Acidobacteria bacterium]|nr:acyl-CoA dehydrogenase family protein [Acidobacteriota bacterium]